MGLPPIIGSLFFPKVLAEFHLAHPNIKIKITEYGAAKVTKSVAEGEIEIGVAVLPIDEEDLICIRLYKEEMKLVIHHKHPFASRKNVRLKELKNEEIIFYSEEFALHQIMWNQFINEGFEPKILFKSSQWDFMSEMVAANLGMTILPESICNRIDNENVRIIDLIPSTPWHLAVITKKEKYVSFAAQTFIDFVLDFVHGKHSN